MSAHSRIRAFPAMSPINTPATTNGINHGTPLPLKIGINQSKTGLPSDRLMKWNRPVSIVWSQSIGTSVTGTGVLKN
jgi:hypothetical protein